MVARPLAAVALAVAVACGSMPRPPVGAPQDSYTPRQFTVEIAGASSTVDGAFVTERFFITEHVEPKLGRFFAPYEHATPGKARVAVVSNAFWMTRLARDPDVIGTTIIVDGQPRTIVGIAPEMFRPDKGGSIWVPGGS